MTLRRSLSASTREATESLVQDAADRLGLSYEARNFKPVISALIRANLRDPNARHLLLVGQALNAVNLAEKAIVEEG